MRLVSRVTVLILLVLFGCVRPAHADLTAFVGFGTDPATRTAIGLAAGLSFLVVGFEVEYMHLGQDLEDAAPSLRTGMINVYAQNPVPIAGLQFYGTIGAGIYGERLEFENGTTIHSETDVGTNLGGGVKIRLSGPLRLRLDYRVFALRGAPLATNPQRFYAGINLAF